MGTASHGSQNAAPADVERVVRERYRAGAQTVESGLCCPVDYDPATLELLPQEIKDKDYGCGDPSRYVGVGETVLDLGSGAGKICYILAQRVGPTGRVIGVDFNDEMLGLARRYQPEMAQRLGYDVVSLRKGRIQDLRLDLAAVEAWLAEHPVRTAEDIAAFEATCERLREQTPLVPEASVDLVVSNCVLNLVRPADKDALFAEIFRVLKRGGRAVISDIVCDEPPTESMRRDPELWSGCISGAFVEQEFLQRFEAAGFHGIEILNRQVDPWQVIEGIEFRAMTVRAYKGKQGPCLEGQQAVVYRGPFKAVTDDDGHTYLRGARMAVCDKTFHLLTDPGSPYAGAMIPVPPREPIQLEAAAPFACTVDALRHPRATKGEDYDVTQLAEGSACGPDCC